MAILYRQGKISRATLDEFVKGVKVSALPKRAPHKRSK